MRQIDTSRWKSYRIGDLFEPVSSGFIGSGRKIGSATTERDESHTVPLTAAKNDNNGIMYWGRPGDFSTRTNVIAIIRDGAVSTGRVFAQLEETGVYSHSYFIRVKNADVTFATNLFLSRILETVIYPRYTRDDACIWERVRDDMIPLPAAGDGRPDWLWMDEYMSAFMHAAAAELDNLRLVKAACSLADSSSWISFRIGDLFDIEKGTRLTRAQMIDGSTPFIGASLENNGITARIGNSEHIHPGGLMTVAYNGQKATGKAFYQPEPFWASDDVNVLYPKFELTEDIALFLCPLFWEAGKPYAFENKWGKEAMARSEIPLPAASDGRPDWKAIEVWMKGIRADTTTRFEQLNAKC